MGQNYQQTDGPQGLDGLRAKIDAIDDALLDLLVHRADVSVAIAKVKQGSEAGSKTSAFRPAREALILRRLLARRRGHLPATVVVRIWREIIAASLHAQDNFSVHACADERQRGFLDLAHAYFGAQTPVRAHARASLVVTACNEEPNAIGIVPLPQAEEPGLPWWGRLAPAGQPGPRIIAKLPFLADEDDSQTNGLAIAAVEQEPTGDDTTFLRVETAPGLSRGTLNAMINDAGFETRFVSAGRAAGGGNSLVLLAAQGFVAADDPRLAILRANDDDAILHIDPVGGFANPVPAANGGKAP